MSWSGLWCSFGYARGDEVVDHPPRQGQICVPKGNLGGAAVAGSDADRLLVCSEEASFGLGGFCVELDFNAVFAVDDLPTFRASSEGS